MIFYSDNFDNFVRGCGPELSDNFVRVNILCRFKITFQRFKITFHVGEIFPGPIDTTWRLGYTIGNSNSIF